MNRIGNLAAALGLASDTLFLVGFALGFARVAPALAAFGMTALGMVLGVLAVILGTVTALNTGLTPRVVFALLGVLPAAFLVYGVASSAGTPLINDISTDLVYPPAFTHAQTLPESEGRDMAYPESFKAQVEKAYPDLRPIGLNRNRDDVFVKAHDIAKARAGWAVTSTTVTDKESIIEGTATSRIFGFVDDFAIRITDAAPGVVVDMRSKSRVGKGDLGANAKRIREFLADLQD
jgi:uncharacterized protein (DUF1499 family)